jgi:hypothetical protein
LSYRDVEELLGERGVEADHVTVYRWVLRFAPLLADARQTLPARGRRPLAGRGRARPAEGAAAADARPQAGP